MSNWNNDVGFVPDFNSPTRTTPRIKKTELGDGYEYRGADGINTINKTYDYTFTALTNVEAAQAQSFLEAQEGRKAFVFTPPTETDPILVVCEDWEVIPVAFNINTLRCTFKRTFN